MIRIFFKLIIMICLIIGAKRSWAQQLALDAPGITEMDKSNTFVKHSIAETAGITKTQIAQFQRSLSQQMSVFFNVPEIRNPVGYSIGCIFSKDVPGRFSNLVLPTCQTDYTFTYLIRDNKTGVTRKSSGSYSYISIQVNGLENIFSQYGSFWKDCSELNLPLFFEQIPITDSTADYLEIGDHNKTDIYSIYNEPVRFIRRNERPIFVPLTRKEFVQFVLAIQTRNLKTQQDAIEEAKQGIIDLNKLADNARRLEDHDIYKDGIGSIERRIEAFKQGISNCQKEIDKCQRMLETMSSEDAVAPARFDPKLKDPGYDRVERLLPLGINNGKLFTKINPNYYDLSPGAPVVQLLIVSYMIPYSGIAEPTILGKKTVDVYQTINYHWLKRDLQ